MARILVIDDEEPIRRLIRLALEERGYSVEEADNGRDATRRLREGPVDVIIMDIFMPEKGGLETLMDIRTDCPEVKCIVMSGGGLTSSLDYLQHAEVFGAARSFVKPFVMSEMLQAVDDLLVR